ncbi:hypothetical protein ADICYQ_4693 [Cyclobacterium qasimii M12-11B]|uniref:Uncharacterized protein n=1 Tax=Cyclobacterium qasimii M12-11B TaxID=641524 RepID=S7V7T0_9BACT|nr:hypothetical protein ADICYQ_4693 [Cyclobacterium qasimii M12-11B]
MPLYVLPMLGISKFFENENSPGLSIFPTVNFTNGVEEETKKEPRLKGTKVDG